MDYSFWNELILSLILGITQGITEFLPISSTAHLRLISEFLIQKDIGLSASNIIQFGTLLAIVQYFWPELKGLFWHVLKVITSKKEFGEFWHNVRSWLAGKSEFVDSKEADQDILIAQVTIATLPIVIFALLMRDNIELLRENILNIAYFLLLGGALIALSEFVHKSRRDTKKSKEMSVWEVLLIGSFQCLAVFPGVSRSGATLAGALFLGRDRQKSVRFSFLLSIPALGLAGVYDLWKVIQEFMASETTLLPSAESWATNVIHPSILAIIIAFFLAYFVGLACLRWLLKYLATNDSRVFIIYRVLLASLILIIAGGWF
jgi:undecaprenyl-diphosphatase